MQSQIWAVIRKDDSIKRIYYSLISTFLGAMCLSGDVTDLSAEQWAAIDRAVAFYRDTRHIIAHGDSKVVQSGITSYSDLKGWQTVVRDNGTEQLVTVHVFGGNVPQHINVVAGEGEILDLICMDGSSFSFNEGVLKVYPRSNFEAAAFRIRKNDPEE